MKKNSKKDFVQQNKLYNLYNTLETIHILNFPYLRFGQFILNFEKYVRNNKNEDLFYVDNNKLIDYLKDYKTENLN